jgi:outer membrane protein
MRILYILIILLFSSISYANSNIAVLDVKKIISESIAAKKASQKLKAKLSEYQLEIDLKSNKLKKEQEKLLEQSALLTQEALQSKQAEFVEKIKSLELEVNKKKENLDIINLKVISEIEKNIDEIVQNIAKKENINLILSKAELIYVNNIKDITDTVIDKLNDKLVEIKIDFEDGK